LVTLSVPENEIAVIAPYRQQTKLISEHLKETGRVEILTADRAQGRDKECIVMSLTRSNSQQLVSNLKERLKLGESDHRNTAGRRTFNRLEKNKCMLYEGKE
jgi:superfamily I DNA and/or RNA helicase